MPELPEVEVTRRELAPRLLGRRISAVHTTAPNYFFLTPPASLKRRLKGCVVVDLRRRGKYLLACLDSGDVLLLHLGMTGQLFTAKARSPRLLSATARSSLAPEQIAGFKPDRHTHLRLCFADGDEDVIFRDVRKFGKVRLLPSGQSDPRLDKLGVDALEATGADLFAAASKRRAPIKTLLLDQGVIAGIGNIYADEGLFLARVRPSRRADRVSAVECDRIVQSCQAVMLRSIETGGSSIADYVRPTGGDGGYQDERKVYAREGLPCPICGARIVRRVLGQRSTHYCPRCQR
ncbi:MAG: bifunctional DNA-formamidopyrimidine glycosylase/DNA-(apurinic or apyrimidinic site) lyase [Planctomycetaceae bacterium]|nr:bifunctional DNA-formamidopyrimidine glycosylase/DNA-(apurinic or apyrimidinic site) lyase [Planctomycetaceae bacterium]